MYLDVAHLDLLLFKGISGLAFAVIERAVDLFAPTLDLLTDTVVLSLLLAQLGILTVAFLLYFDGVVCVQLSEVFISRAKDLKGVRQLGDEGASELVVFRGSRFQRAQLDSPGGHGSARTALADTLNVSWIQARAPLQRARRNGGCVANTEAARFLCLFLVVLLGQRTELGGIFLLYGTALSIKVLDVVEPCDAARNLLLWGLASGA